MTPITERQATIIANNVIAACKDIRKLNKAGYGFIYLASGFIAHYNHGGFMEHYSENSLYGDILDNRSRNMWDNFRPGEQHYEYYMSKKNVYCKILVGLGE